MTLKLNENLVAMWFKDIFWAHDKSRADFYRSSEPVFKVIHLTIESLAKLFAIKAI
jgi:hypothetical protein